MERGLRQASFQELRKSKFNVKRGRHGVICRVNKLKASYPLHRHDFVEIEYLVAGKLEHELNGHKTVFEAGDAWCLDNMDLHMFNVIEPVEIHNVCIDKTSVSDSVKRLLGSTAFPLVGHLEGEALAVAASLFEKLRSLERDDSEYSEERVTAYLLLFLTHIFENGRTLAEKPELVGYEHIAKAIEYISDNYTKQITLAEVAEAVYLSPNYLSKLFLSVSGKNFLDYLSYVRISRAKELLFSSSLSITQVALESGFGSFSSFLRVFRRYTDKTPSEYRAQSRERVLHGQGDERG